MLNDDKKDPIWITLGVYGAVGFQLALAVIAGWFIGNYFDQRWNSSPWLAVTGLVAGFIGGLVNLIRILNWHQRKKS